MLTADESADEAGVGVGQLAGTLSLGPTADRGGASIAGTYEVTGLRVVDELTDTMVPTVATCERSGIEHVSEVVHNLTYVSECGESEALVPEKYSVGVSIDKIG